MSNYHTTRAGFRYLRQLIDERVTEQKRSPTVLFVQGRWAQAAPNLKSKVSRAELLQQIKSMPDRGRRGRRKKS